MSQECIIRPATGEDLADLVALEQAAFSVDGFSRRQVRYLLTEANATTLVAECGDVLAAGATILWRARTMVGRLYTISTHPRFQGQGIGSQLLKACEKEVARRGCTAISLEVRTDNQGAIALYGRNGYQVVEELTDYYPGGAGGLRMRKELGTRNNGALRLDIPYFAQTLEFTCGPACLMMTFKHFRPKMEPNRSLELVLWKEATLIFMTSGLGGCGPFGLAVAAARRGHQTRLILSDQKVPFLSSVRTQEKREVISLVHEQLKEEALQLGVEVDYRNFTFQDIAREMRRGFVPIVLISTYRLHGYRAPHWVVMTGFDSANIYFHDPCDGFYHHDAQQAQDVAIPIAEFSRMRRYGTDVKKSVVFVGPPRRRAVASRYQ